ncbi:3-isopropylmalate dehydratase large subunit [Candidatus Bathyarchaeota archaeon]|nr:3-isopropylmalate dehydratase large subunit [Candidatus Bathyarchaeota archaeon]
MNIIEKILAKASGKKVVHPGEIVEAEIDKAMANDITAPLAVLSFKRMDGKNVWDKEKVILVIDHIAPASSEQSAKMHKLMRDFVEEQSIKYFYDVGRGGVCHQVMVEKHVEPGDVIVGADSHTTTYGALGAFSTGIGSTEMASVWLTGKLWFKIPEAINIIFNGEMTKSVYPKDLILYTIGQLGADGAIYKGVKFSGDTIRNMGVEGRLTLCNMVVEMGGKNGIIEPDEKVYNYLNKQAKDDLRDDEDSEYDKTFEYDASKLEPMVACPSTVDNVKSVSEVEGVKIDQALIGSCTNGRLSDLRIAAEILKNRKVKKGVRALVIPASQDVFKAALNEHLMEIFIDAGVMICNPNCGPCYGGHLGLLAEGEVCISSSNRNFVGRMGSPKADIYLASPATVATSAITGKITQPA